MSAVQQPRFFDARRRRRSVDAAIELAPLALVVIAEAAWISVVGGLLQEFALRPAVLGVPTIAAFVLAGAGLGHVLGPRLGPRWPVVALLLVAAAAVVGWALSGEAREATTGGPVAALAAHPGGLVAGLALLRGFAHARLPLAEDTVTHLLAVGVPGLALASLLGGLVGEPLRSRFLADALGSAIAFVASAALALAFTRLDAVGQDGGFDWRRNPPWLVLTVAILVVAIVAAVPLAAMAGTVLSVVISVALGPLFLVGLATGLDAAGRRLLFGMAVIVAVVVVLTRVFGNPAGGVQVSPALPAGQGQPQADPLMTASIGGVLLLGAVVMVILLVALWMRRTAPPDELVSETRTIDPGGDGAEPPRRAGRFGRRTAPRSAVEAYVALIEDLDRRPAVRREVAESPAAHAARMRSEGRSGLSLDLLAADYALARYAGASLTGREDARAVSRWQRLRRELARSAGRSRPGALAADPSVPVGGMDAAEGARTGVRAG